MQTLPEPADLQLLARDAWELPPLRGSRGRLERLLADYARGFEQADQALVIALVGATGAGKSTLINALSGADIAEEGVNRPTSRHPVLYAPEDALLDAISGVPAKVARYRVRPGAPWAGQVFIDTPDVNSVVTEHREIARAIVDLADVAIVVMHRGSVAEAAQADFLQEFARRRRLLFVLNFADQLGAPAREELKAQVRRLAASRLGLGEADTQVFALSAADAKRGHDTSGELAGFLAALQELGSRTTADRIRRSNALAVLRELQAAATPALSETKAAQQEILSALEKSFGDASAQLREDYVTRLRQAEAHLTNEVRRQASSRWWGPAAWWMRMSMLGAGGLGAAAVLARRNLPLGLAVGAVSTAVDRVVEHARGHAAEQRMLTEDEEAAPLAHAARQIVSAPRAVAHRRDLPPDALGIPAVETLTSELLAARVGAWRYTLEQGVTEATRRWWKWARWILLPLVNLPLLALAGHVAWRVGTAYLEGRYLGFDYFLTAGALAALLAIAGGILASLSLAGAAGRARALGTARFVTALATLQSQVLASATEALAQPRASAERLLRLLPEGGPATSSAASR